MEGSSPGDRLFRAALVAVVVASAALTLALVFRPAALVVHPPLTEDGYYPMTIARNIARGRGITVDGLVPTNGFQPLFTFLTVPLFAAAGEDRLLGARLVLAVHWAFFLATAFVLGRLLRHAFEPGDRQARALAPWAAAAVYLATLPAMGHHFNGLETGCLLFLYAVVLRRVQTDPLPSARAAATLGALLGLVVLARIDAVFFVILLTAFLLLEPGAPPGGKRLRRAAALAAAAFLVSAPWWLYNFLGFGSLMPSSGLAEQRWALEPARLGNMLAALLVNLAPLYLFAWDEWLIGHLVRAAALALLLAILWAKRGEVRRWAEEAGRGGRLFAVTACLVASLLLLFAWYAASSWAVHFYSRYLAPLLLLVCLLLARALLELGRHRPRLAACLALAWGLTVPIECVRAHFVSIGGRNIFVIRQVSMVEARVPSGAWVAALQTGTLGYFRDRVLNLDGKVNPEALRRRDDIWRYLDERGVGWLCDWPEIFRPFFGSRPEANGWELVEHSGKFALFRRRRDAPLASPALAAPER